MSKKAIANVFQDGEKKGVVYLDRTVAWQAPLANAAKDAEKYIELVVGRTGDVRNCIGVIFAVLTLETNFKTTGVHFDLLVPEDFQAQGDVLE